MITRIKYIKSGKNLTSNYIQNFEGKQFIIFIHTQPNRKALLSIVAKGGDVVFRYTCKTVSSAKRVARNTLISNFGVNLIEEMRAK